MAMILNYHNYALQSISHNNELEETKKKERKEKEHNSIVQMSMVHNRDCNRTKDNHNNNNKCKDVIQYHWYKVIIEQYGIELTS